MGKDPELEDFKRLNLGELATAHGYTLDRKESSRSSLVMRHADGDKIIIATGEDGHGVFFSVKADASGSVLDFVMYRQGGNLGHARKTLRAYKPPSFPTARPDAQPIPHDRAALAAQWHRILPTAYGWTSAATSLSGTTASPAGKSKTTASQASPEGAGRRYLRQG